MKPDQLKEIEKRVKKLRVISSKYRTNEDCAMAVVENVTRFQKWFTKYLAQTPSKDLGDKS